MNSAMGQPPEDDALWRRPPDGPPPGAEANPSGNPEARPASTTTRTPVPPGALEWSRAAVPPPYPGSSGPAAAPPPYGGPPRTAPPPPGWRPPTVVQPPAPRALPPQDEQSIDRQEQAARTVTVGVGLLAGAVLVVLLLVFCGRWLF